MNLEEYQKLYGGQDAATPGWDAIDSRLKPVYSDQEPKHWATVVKHMLGGPDPIDGISAYECKDGGRDHLHFCTYGFTSLYYDEEAAGGDFSRFGFELTFRLASTLPPAEDPIWVCSMIQNIARYVFESGNWFECDHWMDARGPLCLDSGTDLVGLVFLNDPALQPIDTPHGRVEFIQMFGITKSELDAIKDESRTVEEIIASHRETNPLLVTDLDRKDQ